MVASIGKKIRRGMFYTTSMALKFTTNHLNGDGIPFEKVITNGKYLKCGFSFFSFSFNFVLGHSFAHLCTLRHVNPNSFCWSSENAIFLIHQFKRHSSFIQD